MKFLKKSSKAFTLVEIIVVLGIIIIISGFAIGIINPNRQRARARDAVLRNTVASIAQTIESFHNLYGVYPSNSGGHRDILRRMTTNGFVVNRVITPPSLTFTNTNVFEGGAAGGAIIYWLANNPDNLEVCLEGESNVTAGDFIGWVPGYPVQDITESCTTTAGYTQLIN